MKAWFVSTPFALKVIVFLASALFLILLAYLFYLLGSFWISLEKLNLKERFAIKNDIIKTTAQILGGAFFLFGLYFTWQNLVLTQEKNRADLYMSQEKQTTDLFTKAIEQLGSDKLEVRMGGIYALERIARDSAKDHGPIMEVLNAYVRQHAPILINPDELTMPKESGKGKRKSEIPWADIKNEIKPPADVQACLTVIGRRARTYNKGEIQRLNLNLTDLRGADLVGAHLEGAYLSCALLEGATLNVAHLEGAIFAYAYMKGAHFTKASLERAMLDGARLEWATLTEANLEGASLWGANLNCANFNGTRIAGANLYLAHLEGPSQYEGASIKVEQLLTARNWILAFLSKEICQKLQLPHDHNQRLENRDLSYYNFSAMDLRGDYLMAMNLQGANFSGAHLEKAFLNGSNLEKAILHQAYLVLQH